MNGIQSRKAQSVNIDKQIPGCLGRMVNLFDLSTGVSGNRLLTDKPHRDGDFLFHMLQLFVGNKLFLLFICFVQLIKLLVTMKNVCLAIWIEL